MSPSILVTGASGFLGKHLVAALERGGQAVATHSMEDGDLARTQPRAQDIRHVYHLAAKTYVPDSWAHPKEFYEANVLGTIGILEYCREQGASLTLISSYMYGHPERLPIPEGHPLRAFNPYGHSKLLAEEVAQFYQTSFRVPVTIVRPFNLYGPGQSERFLIPALIRQALSPECSTISIADHRPRRDYIYVDDVVELLLAVVESQRASVYNAGSGISTSAREVAERIAELAGTGKHVISRNEERPDEVLDTVADISRARLELGWNPRIGLDEGLARTIRSFTVGK